MIDSQVDMNNHRYAIKHAPCQLIMLIWNLCQHGVNHVDMRLIYVDIRLSYVDMPYEFVEMRLVYVNIQDNHVV